MPSTRDFESCFQLSDGVRLTFSTAASSRRHFFGYYDKSPLSNSGTRLLCHVVEQDGRPVQETDKAEIGYWDIPTGTYQRLAETRTFNWQQGSMLQWLGPDFESRIVYNDRRDDRYAAVILDLNTGREQVLPRTIYSVHPNGQYAATPVFERLEFCRPGYCYLGVRDPRWDGDAPVGDGVYSLDLTTGDSDCLISVRDLMRNRPVATMRDGANYVEHMVFNPEGSRFAFFHRWRVADGGIHTRLYTCDADGGNLFGYPDSGMYSHLCWRNNEEIIVTGRPQSLKSRIRSSTGLAKAIVRPALRTFRRFAHWTVVQRAQRKIMADSYLHFKDQSRLLGIVARNQLIDEGHPGARPGDSQWLLTDTYPDTDHLQRLLAFHLPTNQLLQLGTFTSLPAYANSGHRCDLHPRWDPSGRFVIIDSLCSGRRQMYVLDVQQALAKAVDTATKLAA